MKPIKWKFQEYPVYDTQQFWDKVKDQCNNSKVWGDIEDALYQIVWDRVEEVGNSIWETLRDETN